MAVTKRQRRALIDDTRRCMRLTGRLIGYKFVDQSPWCDPYRYRVSFAERQSASTRRLRNGQRLTTMQTISLYEVSLWPAVLYGVPPKYGESRPLLASSIVPFE